MTLLEAVARRAGERDLVWSFVALSGLLTFTLGLSSPGAGVPSDAWETVAQARSAALLLVAVGLGSAGVGARYTGAGRYTQRGPLETLIALWLLWLLVLPLEAFAFATSYPDAPVWWLVLGPLFDGGAYFGVGLLLGRATRRSQALAPLLPPLVFAALFGLSTFFGEPLLNPLATASRFSWVYVIVAAGAALATLAACVRAYRRGTPERA